MKKYFATHKNQIAFLISSILMLTCLLMGAIALTFRWEEALVLLFTFAFSLFLVVSVIMYANRIRENDYEKLRGEKLAAEKDAEIKLQYLANMAHEIRTPINAIIGYDELILREYNDPALRQYAGNIKSASNVLLSIVNDSLDYSRIEAGKMELIPTEYDLGIMIEELISMLRPRALSKGLDMKCNINSEIPHILYGDSDRIKQCVINILTNAVKYTDEGEIVFSVDYENIPDISGFGRKEILVKFAVKDTGIGIKEDDLNKLFSPFERIGEKTIRSVEGTGLGLSIVRRILALMDSKLEVESEYGKGSNFHFSIKQDVIRMDPIGDFNQAYINSVVGGKTYKRKFTAPDARILVVDDGEMNLSVMEGLLKETRIQVDSALSATIGLELARNNDYDIIFIDRKMPGIDGEEMIKLLRGNTDEKNKKHPLISKLRQDKDEEETEKSELPRNAKTPCIALTAGAILEVQSEYEKKGYADYLLKPIVYKELEMVLQHYLPAEKMKMAQDKIRKNASNIPTYMTDDKFDEAIDILRSRES